jgi:hypothetical protein
MKKRIITVVVAAAALLTLTASPATAIPVSNSASGAVVWHDDGYMINGTLRDADGKVVGTAQGTLIEQTTGFNTCPFFGIPFPSGFDSDGTCNLLSGRERAGAPASRSPVAAFASLPPALRATISRVVARDDHSYRVRALGRGFVAENRRNRLALRFTGSRIGVRSGSGRLGLSLRAWGHGRTLRKVVEATPEARGNEVFYRRGGLVEWYANGPLGLEQGFVLKGPPPEQAAGRLTLALELSGNMRGLLAPGGDAVTFAARGRQSSLAYGGLIVTDARGRGLLASIELAPGRLLLRVSDAAARYPLTIDTFVQQAMLTPSDGERVNLFGDSVAVSDDLIVVGAPGATVGGKDSQGAVYVFVRPAGGWVSATETAKLTASDGMRNDNFGASVAISGDTIVAGAPSVGGDDPGAVYFFVKPSGSWASGTETGKLTASDSSSRDHVGSSVATSGDVIVAGAPKDNGAVPALYVFVMPTGGWTSATETAKLTASAHPLNIGLSVAISGDTIVAGAPYETVGGNEFQGAAYVFVRPAGGWASSSETAKLTASDGDASDNLGNSVAIWDNTIVAGAPSIPALEGDGFGAAYVFVRPPAGWANSTETAKLTASDDAANSFGEGFLFGYSVAIAGDTIVAGAPNATIGTIAQGALYVFVKPDGGWASATETAELIAAGGEAGDGLGNSLAISADTIVAGTIRQGEGDPGGIAWLFASSPGALTVLIDIKPGSSTNPINLGSGGLVPVAILSTDSFDATTVDPSSVCFGDAEEPAQRDCTEAHGKGHVEDVNGDGRADLLLHFEVGEAGIDFGDTTGVLTGETRDGISIEGSDTIKTS